ncbi:ABC-F family ATP-binding cassette domain-containing protein [Salisediminibacterium beveridgei]|uniref:Putative ABC transporter ATP-binding protein YfmR n=1 Tax=Salisediminibacterium beveridgei TaxID=632773 RepID=A0A1D7QXI0_9BACI|nr:ABC-F family ATP-binding cassette domain-containing protein [Salisediminibacterium beveridgei]AOM83709.1 putative ABC transporter ATP-binding protein YfmR [Salisediminibacterium beveridgei]
MTILQCNEITKTFGEKVLFDKISFSIGERERIGLIGVNGTGKSTLLKTIAGIEGKEHGSFEHAGNFSIEYMPQDPEFPEGVSVLDIVFGGEMPIIQAMRHYEMVLAALEADPSDEKLQRDLVKAQERMDRENAWDANTQAKTILSKLGITTYTKEAVTLSGGQKKRVAIARSLIQPVDLLLLDEPTNHLDNLTIEWLEGFLSNYPGALMLITHDRYFLNRVTEVIFELDHGRLFRYEGNYEAFLEKRAERELNEAAQEDKRQNLLRREIAWLKRGAKARTTKQKARKQRIETIQENKPVEKDGELDFAIGSVRLGKKVIELENVSKEMDGKLLFSELNELIVRGDRVGMIGPNGIGKSTLLNIIAGRHEPDNGTIDIGETVRIGYYTQDHDTMDEDLRMIDYIKETAEAVKTIHGELITAEQMLERFLFTRPTQRTHIRRLSGGERRRLYLLKVLMEEPNVLFLDEPTNDLDTTTLSILEDYLDQFPGVVITVSHDRYFLDRVVDRLLVFKGDGQVSRYQGSYSDWLDEEKKQQKAANEQAKQEADKKKNSEKKPKQKLSYREQEEWKTIEDRIMTIEEELEAVSDAIDSCGSDFDKARELYEKQQQLETDLENAMNRWEELSIRVESMKS